MSEREPVIWPGRESHDEGRCNSDVCAWCFTGQPMRGAPGSPMRAWACESPVIADSRDWAAGGAWSEMLK